MKNLAITEGIDLQRLRRQVAFGRLLYVDDCVPVFSAMYAKRVRGYEAVGYVIRENAR